MTTANTLKVQQTDALPVLEDGIASGIRKLEADYEATAGQPVRLDPGPPPLALTLGDLRETEEAQRDALERIVEIVTRAEEDVAAVNPDLRADLIDQQKRRIREQALEQASKSYGEMACRSEKAKAGRGFFERGSILTRARFSRDDQVHYAATSAWCTRLAVTPGGLLVEFARTAVAAGDIALSALVLEAALGREDVSDAVRNDVKSVVSSLTLSEADEALALVNSIVHSEAKANIQMQKLNRGRLDALSKSGRDKIGLGMNERRGRGALV